MTSTFTDAEREELRELFTSSARSVLEEYIDELEPQPDPTPIPSPDPDPEQGSGVTQEDVVDLIRQHGGMGVLDQTLEIHVNPHSGENDNAGTERRPVRTIQEASNRVPVFNRSGAVRIILDEPGYYDEDVSIGPYINGSMDGGNFRVIGDRDRPEDYRIGSMAVQGCIGVAAPSLWGFSPTRENGFISDGAGIFIYASQEPRLDSIHFLPEDGSNLEVGIEAYSGSTINTRKINVDNTVHGIKTKRNSSAWNRDTSGHAEYHVYWATEASLNFHWNDETNPTWDNSPWQEGITRQDNGSIAGDRSTLKARWMDVAKDLTVRGRQI